MSQTTNISSTASDETASKNNLIEKILHQGQRLRNAMVQSILDHDPFNTDIFNDYNINSHVPSRLRKKIPSQCSSLDNDLQDIEKQKIQLFLKGESMNKQDQVEALETLRSMSSENLCKTTNETFLSKCVCATCLKYEKGDLSCDLKRFKKQICINEKEEKDKDEISPKVHNENEIIKYLKYVDCMQISIHDLILNDTGNKKVNSYVTADKKMLAGGSQTFFIEYELPFILSVSTSGKKVRKSVTSVSHNNFVRICARRISTEAVHFKHTSVHNIKNVDQISLGRIKLKFQITCRTMRQKNVVPLGYVVFNFAKFELSPTLTCIEELPVNFDDTVPIVLGKLHVTVQMGYGRLYFGNELLACFERSQKSLQIPDIDERTESVSKKTISHNVKENEELVEKENISLKSRSEPKINDQLVESQPITEKTEKISTFNTKTILFGFIYIPEALYSKADINSFITCRPFCQEDNCYSELLRNESKPIFNFCQLIPLIYNEELLQRFRENFMVVEFWEKFETKNILLGLTKLPLTQFYLTYRNPEITKYLLSNELPVISSDGWETITNPYTEEFIGQVQVLLALGTEQQIHNLQISRGFKTDLVQAKLQTPLEKNKEQISKHKSTVEKTTTVKKKNFQPSVAERTIFKSVLKPSIDNSDKNLKKSTTDQSVQFDSEMDLEVPTLEKEIESNGKLEQILTHLITMKNQQQEVLKGIRKDADEGNKSKSDEPVEIKSNEDSPKGQRNPVETLINSPEASPSAASNTNDMQYQNMSPLVRSTSDLLSSLQAALSIPPPMRQSPQSEQQSLQQCVIDRKSKKMPGSLKVHIEINQAMHLPIRKKCKAKRNKGKPTKLDDNIKPSSYVTFETMPGLDLKMTPLVQKSTNPQWNYKCDVILPSILLMNNKKRLIFKVWRKSTNTNMVPNLQTDSIIGFAAVDLTVLLSGLPSIKGWFNIIDLSSKCNGQINIHVTPLEDLTVFKMHNTASHMPSNFNENINSSCPEIPTLTPQSNDNNNMHGDEGDGELLSRALKRKFAELDEITQRLRLRLSHVTNDETEDVDDGIAEQFERDINTLSIEEDFDMINFEQETGHTPQLTDLLRIECSSDSSSERASVQNALCISTDTGNANECVEESLDMLDRQLLIGKHRIDTLLGKLSLISGDVNSSRHISGCSGSNCEESANIDTEAILKDLNRNSRPNINASMTYNKEMFQQIYEYPGNEDETDSNISCNTSVISHLEDSRPAPDGEGTLSEDRNKVKNF